MSSVFRCLSRLAREYGDGKSCGRSVASNFLPVKRSARLGSRASRKRGDDVTAFAGRENFYVILGSSAGALIGLQFVVMTLIAEMPTVRDVERAGSAFATPTIVHFGVALLL